MKVLVLSDSHGFSSFAERAVRENEDCKTVFFLGDGLRDIEKTAEKFPDREYICVAGNNDFYSRENTEAYKHISSVTIMACHGHLFNVRFSLRDLINSANSVRANLVLYGHTHIQKMYNDPVTGICAVNPGALCDGKYCMLTIENGGYDIEFSSVFSE